MYEYTVISYIIMPLVTYKRVSTWGPSDQLCKYE